MSKSGTAGVDPVRATADALRKAKSLPYAVAKLERGPGGDGQYVEFFRGKDLVRYVELNPGVVKERPGRTPDEAAGDLVRAFISRGLLYRAERKYKRPKPGRTRVVKFPRTLELVPDQVWDPAAFYAWRYDRPTSMWYWAASIAVPLVVILACLFPLAPWWARLGLVYSLMAVLVALLGMLLVRYLAFATVWTLSGASFWLFPNMMSETVGILEAFTPVVSFKTPKHLTTQWQARLATAVVLAGVFWTLGSHSPDLSHLKDDVSRAHDSFREYMDVRYGSSKGFLHGADTAQGTNEAQPGPGGGSPGPGSAAA